MHELKRSFPFQKVFSEFKVRIIIDQTFNTLDKTKNLKQSI